MTTDERPAAERNGTRESLPEIVVGVDGSLESRTALDWASAAAERRGARLVVVNALDMPLIAMPFSAPVRMNPMPEVADRASGLLTTAVGRVAETQPGLKVRSEVSSPTRPRRCWRHPRRRSWSSSARTVWAEWGRCSSGR
ncbi:universal stress protein [Nocardiopsis composta]